MERELQNLMESISFARGSSSRRGGVKTRGGRLPPIRCREAPNPSAPKTFVPCIPQRRHKVKEDATKDLAENTKTNTYTERGTRRDRGRGRGRKEYIQVAGSIFGEGPSIDKSLKKAPREYSGRDDKTAAPVAVPVYKPSEKKTKEEKEEDEQLVINLLADSNAEDLPDEYEQSKPVCLPLIEYADKVKKDAKEIDQNIKIKEEPCIKEEKLEIKDEEEDLVKPLVKVEDVNTEIEKILYGDIKREMPLKKEKIKEEKLFAGNFFTDIKNKKGFGRGIMSFLQFPSALPVTGVQNLAETSVSNEAKGKDASASADSEIENKPVLNESLSLASLKDGKIGKIQILKSGKVRMILGGFTFNVESGSSVSFREEVVNVRSELNSNDVAVLGNVEQHLLCYPVINDNILNSVTKIFTEEQK